MLYKCLMYFLSFLLSWLCGMLVILIVAFFSYDQFSIIDIMSFAIMTFAGCLILFLLIYIFLLRFINKKIIGNKQFVYFPVIFSLVANLPAYFLIWKNTGVLYVKVGATLFSWAFYPVVSCLDYSGHGKIK